MKSFSKQFNGEKEGYAEWYRLLKVELLQGLFPVATNQKIRPLDLTFEMWHADINQQATLAILTNKIVSSQERWDIDNGKSYAAIINSLTDYSIAKAI
jgi:hypothetical protein